ncbi:MAG: DUF1501 domain-containing protein [Chloroflexota bacterium]
MTTTLSRRKFVKSMLTPKTSIWPQWMPRLSFAPGNQGPRGDTLVCIFLRGAADVLNMVVPHGEDAYYEQRPTLAIPRPDDRRSEGKLRTQDLDGFFGLHPALAPLLPAWQAQDLAIVHAVGSPDQSRSHFKAMALMERGLDQNNGPTSGWLGRHLATLNTGNHSPLRGVSIGEMVAHSLRGPIPSTALRSITDFHLGEDPQAVQMLQQTLSSLYNQGDGLDPFAVEAMNTLQAVGGLESDKYKPTEGAIYPDDEFGLGLRQVAMLIKAEVGLEVACVDLGGWDTHIAQGGSEGLMAWQLTSLAHGLQALYRDLADKMDQTVVVVMSEFGRRVKENGGFGTDHGHGSAMFILGGNVAGGQVYGLWPGLSPENLIGPGDLPITTDYRDILGEIVLKRLNNPNLNAVFPDYQPSFRDIVTRI